jgi:hypothetical protein
MIKVKCLITAVMVSTAVATVGVAGAESGAELVSVSKIWDAAPHNAFTDLIRFQGRWYCIFREGSVHAGDSMGVGRIISAVDGVHWESVATLKAEGDVRDPKLCITPDGRIMALAGAALYRRQAGQAYPGRNPHQTLAWFSRDGRDWTSPVEVTEADWWIWRVTWHKGVAYGVGREPDRMIPRLYRSEDGVRFETWSDPLFGVGSERRGSELETTTLPHYWRPDIQAHLGGSERLGSEASLLFLPDGRALCLIRSKAPNGSDDAPALLGRAEPPYRDWQWQDVRDQEPPSHGVRIGGPQLVQLPDGRIVVGGRRYKPKRDMMLWWLDAASGQLTPLLALPSLPSEKDTGYPGLVFHDGFLWVSFYSGTKKKTAVYLAKVKLPPPAD